MVSSVVISTARFLEKTLGETWFACGFSLIGSAGVFVSKEVLALGRTVEKYETAPDNKPWKCVAFKTLRCAILFSAFSLATAGMACTVFGVAFQLIGLGSIAPGLLPIIVNVASAGLGVLGFFSGAMAANDSMEELQKALGFPRNRTV